MKYINKIPFVLQSLLYLMIGVLIFTFLNFVDIFSNNVANTMIYVLFFILIFFNNSKMSKKSKKKGLIVGATNATILVAILLVLKFIFKVEFTWSNLIYALFIYLTSIVGGIIGANTKKSSNF